MTNSARDLRMRVLEMFSDLEDARYDGNLHAARDLLGKVRESLLPSGGQLGMWEASELNDAEQALEAGFPKIALIAAGKAIAVHQLSDSEYAFGFSVARRPATPDESSKTHVQGDISRVIAAGELFTEQKKAANALEKAEEDTARKLGSVEEATAEALADSQSEAAASLLKTDGLAAAELMKAQLAELEGIKANEAARTAHIHEQEQALSWMAGGYTVEYHMPVLPSQDAYTAMKDTQKTAALVLKGRQVETAADLKASQADTASGLKKSEMIEAAGLKAGQEQAAIELREIQTIKAIQKATTEKTRNSDLL